MLSRIKKSLAHAILFSMSARIALVVLSTALFSYLHIMDNFEELLKKELQTYTEQRTSKESIIFQLAKDNQARYREHYVKAWKQRQNADSTEAFYRIFERNSDGVFRAKESAYSGANLNSVSGGDITIPQHMSAFIDIDTDVSDPIFQNKIVLAYDLLEKYSLGWSGNFTNSYAVIPSQGIIIYWPKLNWAKGVPATYDLGGQNHVSYRVEENQELPDVIWTELYFDATVEEWMLTCQTIIIDENGDTLAYISNDILLNNLFEDTLKDNIAGSYNYIIREGGDLVVHPDFTEELRKNGSVITSSMIQTKAVGNQYNSMKPWFESSDGSAKVIYDNATESYLSFAKIDGPNWFFVTVYPKSQLSKPAKNSALFILFLGVVSLFIELGAVYSVLVEKVLKPMAKLKHASYRVKEGNYKIANLLHKLKTNRIDEVGKLAGAFLVMADKIHTHNDQLEQQVIERTKELNEARKQAELQARTDPLTSLPNRRAFYEISNHVFDYSKRYNQPLSVVILDIDKFKMINDNYGHAVGDQALKALAESLQELRMSDVSARFGGEEFIILLANVDLKIGLSVAERIRASIKAIELTLENTTLSFTASFGIAELTTKHTTLDELIIDADAAMYQAKEQGRDRIICYKESNVDKA